MKATSSGYFALGRLRKLAGLVALAVVLLAAGVARAGEIKFGAQPLPVDENGKITAQGRKAAVAKLENDQGGDAWMMHLWAKLDRPAPGPLYVEFYGRYKGQRYQVWTYEHSDFDGSKYLSLSIELEGRSGFNKNKDYEVVITQLDMSDRNLTLAKGKIALEKVQSEELQKREKTERETEKLVERAQGDDLEDEDYESFDDAGLQDADTVPVEPPPLEEPPVSRCSLDPGGGVSPWSLALVAVVAAGARRRRRAG
jgi:MYXO-CTERM domain-containing protein